MTQELIKSEDMTMKIVSDEGLFYRSNQMAEMMSNSQAIPTHLRGDHGACFNIVLQAMQWRMNPFAVAQKTHSIKGNIGYEAQLINAVINAHAPIKAPIDFEFIGPWENILGKFTTCTNEQGKQYNKSTFNPELEKGCGVRAWATLEGEDKPRIIEVYMAQCPVRNSTNWANDPQQQLAYMAQKKWSRRYCPEIILGVYSADEMPESTKAPERNITPQPEVVENNVLDAINAVEAQKVEDPADLLAKAQERLFKALKPHDNATICGYFGHLEQIGKFKSITAMTIDDIQRVLLKTEETKQSISKWIEKQNQPQPQQEVPAVEPQVITAAQVTRLHTIKSSTTITDPEYKEYLKESFGFTSTKDIHAGTIYDQICNWLESQPKKQPETPEDAELDF